ncbi:peptide deformylase [Canibacter sp. lx-72]|uniref:peptide deformylase n=1 Tax=Canibacter zhuwentaonis TaxID=2837491 RepID=UPI001BDCCD44|nr:peptide deformylase [Canibacter zhuwentaonis]MBT1018232.1 peptide deformylase [Canibacter zhuwentaonis]MBT1035242.1 peptide deformylase [Canibacter zhuwentaonis]
MAIRAIRTFGDPVLRQRCTTVTDITDGVRAHVTDLLETVDMDGRAGLASTQIGNTMRIFSLNICGKISYIINPELETFGELEPVREGCLSVPDLMFPVLRYPRARVTGVNLAGQKILIEGDGLLAQALQHECDHLEGKLYIQRLAPELRREAMRQIRGSSWF